MIQPRVLAFAVGISLAVPATQPADRTRGGSLAHEIGLEAYGAVCDGVTDDSAALQAAFTAAATPPNRILRLPAKTCAFAKPLVVGGNKGGSYDHVSIVGVSEDRSILRYTGPNTETAITLSHVGYFHWENLGVIKADGPNFASHGASTGILLTGPFNSGGTQTLAGDFSHLAVSGFKYGMIYGAGDAASEIACYHCRFHSNDVGWTASGYNALNFHFFMVDLLANTRGMEIGGDGTFASQVTDGPHVHGGATAGNREADFFLGNTFGITTLENIRAEPANRFVKGGANSLILRNNTATPTRNPDGIVVDVSAGETFVMEHNAFAGRIRVGTSADTGGTTASVVMRGNTVREGMTGYPIVLPPTARGIKLDLMNNINAGSSPIERRGFPDVVGLYTSEFVPWQTSGHELADPPGGGLFLSAVRMLGYGTSALGKNLRERVTFAGRPTQAHTFKRTVSLNAKANSTLLTFAAGAITAADIGKTIVLPDATSDCGYDARAPRATDAVDARIVAVPTPTTATVAFRAWRIASPRCKQVITRTGTYAAVVGEDEPDANYFLTVSCNANERVSWSNKQPTGFTLTSDNIQSTALCDVLLVR